MYLRDACEINFCSFIYTFFVWASGASYDGLSHAKYFLVVFSFCNYNDIAYVRSHFTGIYCMFGCDGDGAVAAEARRCGVKVHCYFRW